MPHHEVTGPAIPEARQRHAPHVGARSSHLDNGVAKVRSKREGVDENVRVHKSQQANSSSERVGERGPRMLLFINTLGYFTHGR